MHEKDYSSYVDGLGNNLYGTELLKAKNVWLLLNIAEFRNAYQLISMSYKDRPI